MTVMQDGDLEVIAHYTTDSAEYPTYEQKIKLILPLPVLSLSHFRRILPSYSQTLLRLLSFLRPTTLALPSTSLPLFSGLYTVRAKFISSDPDYNASDMEATLTISRTGSGDGDETPSGDGSGNLPNGDNGGSGTLDEILAKLKELPLWQLIASGISIILIIVFLSKTAGYESKRKKYNKKAEKFESIYAAAPFLGLAMSGWTAIACVLMGLAAASLVIMLIAKSRYNKAEENFEEAREDSSYIFNAYTVTAAHIRALSLHITAVAAHYMHKHISHFFVA